MDTLSVYLSKHAAAETFRNYTLVSSSGEGIPFVNPTKLHFVNPTKLHCYND